MTKISSRTLDPLIQLSLPNGGQTAECSLWGLGPKSDIHHSERTTISQINLIRQLLTLTVFKINNNKKQEVYQTKNYCALNVSC